MKKENRVRLLINLMMVFLLVNLIAARTSATLTFFWTLKKSNISKKSTDSSRSDTVLLEKNGQNAFNSDNNIPQHIGIEPAILLFPSLVSHLHFFADFQPEFKLRVIPSVLLFLMNKSLLI